MLQNLGKQVQAALTVSDGLWREGEITKRKRLCTFSKQPWKLLRFWAPLGGIWGLNPCTEGKKLTRLCMFFLLCHSPRQFFSFWNLRSTLFSRGKATFGGGGNLGVATGGKGICLRMPWPSFFAKNQGAPEKSKDFSFGWSLKISGKRKPKRTKKTRKIAKRGKKICLKLGKKCIFWSSFLFLPFSLFLPRNGQKYAVFVFPKGKQVGRKRCLRRKKYWKIRNGRFWTFFFGFSGANPGWGILCFVLLGFFFGLCSRPAGSQP